MKFPKITADMDSLIIRAYQESVGMKSCTQGYHPVKELAKRLGLPRWKVTRRATKLGLHAVKRKEPDWSEKEIKILSANAHYSPRWIQEKLKKAGFIRSETGIMLKRKRMRLLKNLKGQAANQLAMCFGTDRKTITRWIKKGWLKAQKRGTARTEAQGGDMWFIKDKWIREFIIGYVDVIDFRKLDKYYLVDLLAGGINGTGPAKEMEHIVENPLLDQLSLR